MVDHFGLRGAIAVALAVLATGCVTPSTTPTAAAPEPMPPPAAGTRIALVNAGFESTTLGPRGDPEGWFSFQHAGPLSYKYTADTSQKKSGERSLRIDNIGPEIYGAVAQVVDARPHKGKVAKLSGWVKTIDANDNGAVLTLLATQSGSTMAQNFMLDAPIKGTTDWKRYTITLPIPPAADRVEVGMMLRGRGTVWLDDVELEIVLP
ncbi:MAG: hypothetical protein ABIO63_07175 [Casimicrobiaceae bacterium]